MTNVTIPRSDIRAVDANGMPTRDLYRWMRDVTVRIGGAVGGSTSDALALATSASTTASQALAAAHLRREQAQPQRDVDDMAAMLAWRSYMPKAEPSAAVDESQAVLVGRIFGRRA